MKYIILLILSLTTFAETSFFDCEAKVNEKRTIKFTIESSYVGDAPQAIENTQILLTMDNIEKMNSQKLFFLDLHSNAVKETRFKTSCGPACTALGHGLKFDFSNNKGEFQLNLNLKNTSDDDFTAVYNGYMTFTSSNNFSVSDIPYTKVTCKVD